MPPKWKPQPGDLFFVAPWADDIYKCASVDAENGSVTADALFGERRLFSDDNLFFMASPAAMKRALRLARR